MFTMIESLEPIVQALSPVFTQPSLQTHLQVFLGWITCLGRRTEYGVFQTIEAETPISRNERHPFDRFYNFFSRSAWTVHDLAYHVAVAVVLSLNPKGPLYLVVDDTLLHKWGKGAYSAKNLLGDLDERVTYVGAMRSDAAIYDPVPPKQPPSKRGRKPSKGPRLASPKEAMKHADRNRSGTGPWAWQWVEATAYGVTRRLQVLSLFTLIFISPPYGSTSLSNEA